MGLGLRWWLGMEPKFTQYHPKKYSITVVIPAYNEENFIRNTIESIKNQSISIDNIIVVDDCSSDRTGEVSKESGATVARTSINQGTKALAQNFVMSSITTDLVVTIDADTILDKYAIERTLPYFNNELTASVCGFVIPRNVKTIWEKGRFIEYLLGISLFKAAQNNVGAVLVSSGCFSVFRTKLLQMMGGFKQRTMAEDMDLTWEFHFKGYKIYLVPDAYCYPVDPSTFKIYVGQVTRWISSFFQNVSIHKKSLIRNRIGLFVFFYLLDGIVSPILVFMLSVLLSKSLFVAFLMTLIIEISTISTVSLLKAFKLKMFWKAVISLPAFFIIRPVNMFLFLKCMVNEWVLGKRLCSWDKGH